MTRGEREDPGLWLVDLKPTPRQNRSAIAVGAIVLAGFAAAAPFARQPLGELNAFFPSLDAIVLVSGLITAVLLFAQFVISRSRALLALAIGYLFTALIVVPHALTFTGAFSATGLFRAGIQTGSYLFIFWHLGFALAVLAYSILRRGWHAQPVAADRTMVAIVLAVAGVIALVCALTWLSTAGVRLLPSIISDQSRISRVVIYPISLNILIFAAANLILSTGRRSVLDHWLMVVTLASILELVFSGLIPSVRFSVGFYAGRILSIITSSIVLIVLLAETTWLYVRLAASNAMLLGEKENRLMNMEAMISSIAHEIRQPLGAISINGDVTLLLLDKAPPDLAEAKSAVSDIVADGQRISEVLDNIRALFGTAGAARETVDINALVLEVLQLSKFECERLGIRAVAEISPRRLIIAGHRSQLRELLGNLAQNAIEAMASSGKPGTLRFRTGLADEAVVVMSVEDTGPGIAPEKTSTIFEAFVTTKSEGRGLGLAICKMIAERHSGELSVSPAKPHGAIFQVSLPLDATQRR